MTELTVTIVPPFSAERIPGRKVWRMWKWERRFVWIVFVMALEGRERRGEPLIDVAAQFMMIVGVPSCVVEYVNSRALFEIRNPQ